MSIRLCNQVFIRHVDDESVVWCPRTDGCTVMSNAKPILDEIKREWRRVGDIVLSVAGKFECAVDEVREGVEAVLGELVSQRFVEVETSAIVEGVPFGAVCEDSRPPDDDWTPLRDFYMCHGLPSELHIDLTDGCNEKCVHCYLSHGGKHYIDKEKTTLGNNAKSGLRSDD